jgi:hypothetical protein
MFTIDKSWTAASIPIENEKLDAFYRELTREEKSSNVWQQRYSASVVAQGGGLVTRLRDSLFYVSGVAPSGANTYKAVHFPAELWYLPRCTFEESRQCLGFFGFPAEMDQSPGSKGVSNPAESMKRVRGFLERMAMARVLTMDGVSSTTVQYRLVKGAAFTRKEVLDVLNFNDVEFGASRERWERREYIKMFLAHQFFVLGAF